MNKLIEQIEKIREINRQHKLVIFVGAGVSKNSGVCSWAELVKEMAVAINYNDICDKCELKHLITTEGESDITSCKFNNRPCQYKFNFSNDEFLKIPQYYFEEKGEKEYIDFLREKFCKSYESNIINEVIVELEPEHIITTNYDHLIENVKVPNISDYFVVKDDSDLLTEKAGRKYIIKMHGDIDNLESIVLKEDDYLNYSKNHELIEMYIKSLLIDKTFLFVGYSLNDNNLKLILSYINFLSDKLNTKRFKNYLVTNDVVYEDRALKYWKSKKFEIVNLSNVTQLMMEKTPCELEKQGKPLYSFMKYLKDDELPFAVDKTEEMKYSILNKLSQFKPFNAINYVTILSVFKFTHTPILEGSVLNFFNESDYNDFFNILSSNDETSCKIKEYLNKSGISYIRNTKSHKKDNYYKLFDENAIIDDMFELSISWDYVELENRLSLMPDSLEKAYYYSLIYKTSENKCFNLLSQIEVEINKKDFKSLNLKDKYEIAILQFNLISLRLLNYEINNKEQWNKLNKLLESASNQSKAFEYIKRISEDDGEILNKLHGMLIKHEEYYTKKSTMTKWGGTIYGDLLKIQAVVYDYYYFYKKNYLMLDWFNNVSKICESYIKAIFCTYYPDEYQYSRTNFGRTRVEPYPLNLTDVDMIIRHVKFKDFKSWVSYYKVFKLMLKDELDIAVIFDNFCTSIKNCWLIAYEEYINNWGLFLSLLELSEDKCHDILSSYIKLVTPDEKISIVMLRNCLRSLWLFIDKHSNIEEQNYILLNLLINEFILINPLDMENDYRNLISKLYVFADEKIYKKCCDIIENCDSDRKKSYYPYIFIEILLKFDETKWKLWIKDNIANNWNEEIFYYLEKKIILFDVDISKCIETKLEEIKRQTGVCTFPDSKTELLNTMVILIILGIVPDLNEVEYLKKYCDESDYLDFIFNPESFDYGKINTADYMWCNFINSKIYRNIILEHKDDFWNKDSEKRIELGFGGEFEKRVVYKYLFE